MKSSKRPKRGYHHGDLKNALIATGLRLVAERGPEGFSLREAAREVGVSPGAAYRHFADKEALLAAVAADGLGRLATHMERVLSRVGGEAGSAGRAVASFVALGEAYVDFAVRHPAHFRVMFGPCVRTEGFEPLLSPSGRDPFDILVAVLDDLLAAGVIRPEARLGAELSSWAFVHGLAWLTGEGPLSLSARERAAAIAAGCRTWLAGMGADPALLPAAPPPGSFDPRPVAARGAPAGRPAC